MDFLKVRVGSFEIPSCIESYNTVESLIALVSSSSDK